MRPTTAVALVDGVRVVVPDSLDLLTPYVLREQGDWFEDDVKFVRQVLKPGAHVIDIGANYGIYTLAAAQVVGPGGRVWAYEPASSTAETLGKSIELNGFRQVTLERCAVSSVPGSAELCVESNSEMNALRRGAQRADATETVRLVTLDAELERNGWQRIDFVKIDAEGEEAGILQGGQRFFQTLSPVVQYEVKAQHDVHLELVDAFARLGYSSYRLVPGLACLVPFDPSKPVDPYLLNLYGCKPDAAQALARRGLMVGDTGAEAREGWLTRHIGRWRGESAYEWRAQLGRLPYGSALLNLWTRTVAVGESAELEGALASYAVSRDRRRSTSERYASLQSSYGTLRRLCENSPRFLRLSSLARVAAELGERAIAVNALEQLAEHMRSGNIDPAEPFLPPLRRFDVIKPAGALYGWLDGAVLEALERLQFFSSYYAGARARSRLERIRDLGYADAEMNRRLELVTMRFGTRSA